MPDSSRDRGLVEIGDRCWVLRAAPDVSVGLVGGEAGLLLVDTGPSDVEARRVVEQVRRLGAGDVVAVFHTHGHRAHTSGDVVVSEAYDGPPVVAHERADVTASRVPAPTRTFSSARVVDLGDRQVELLHPGRGHTAGDAVARVPDADVLFSGDLVEESASRSAVPGFGADCFPLEWPGALDLVIALLTTSSAVVPGHGAPVDRGFVERQRDAIGVVAETVRDLATRGVPASEAVASAQWPYPAEHLGHAVRRGYEQLPRSARSLPLI